jgi:fructose-bisphosphate aldolase class II
VVPPAPRRARVRGRRALALDAMPLATPAQYRRMIDTARHRGYAYPAVNVTSSQTLSAALRGFADARSDGIVQITTAAAEYLSGPARRPLLGARAFAELAHALAEEAPVLVALHTDHAAPDRVDDFLRPLLAEARRRRAAGRPPLFHSHMFDGSSLPLAENLAIARDLLREANELDVLLEIEIGIVGGEEDGVDNSQAPRAKLYSRPEDAVAVADALGAGERGRYLLAATFGNVHGHYAPGNVELRPELLASLQGELARRYGSDARFDFVFHGGSGSTPDEVSAAVANGVVKMNVDTDLQYAFSQAIVEHVQQHANSVTRPGEAVDKHLYDPRAWGAKAEAAMAARVARAARALGSGGQTLAGTESALVRRRPSRLSA